MQARAAEDLRKGVTGRLVAAGLVYEGAKAFVTPRRLTLAVHGVPVRQPDIREEKKGPRVGAPDNAIAGFLKAAGLKSIGEAKVQPDKKGDFYVALIEKTGPRRARRDRRNSARGDQKLSVAEIDALGRGLGAAGCAHLGAAAARHRRHFRAGDRGPRYRAVHYRRHRRRQRDARPPFSRPGEIHGAPARRLQQKLDKAKVVLDAERRRVIILTEAKQLAFAQGLELVADEGLLNEVAGLVEWPVVLMGGVRPEISANPGRSHPRHHPQQPEMLCAARRRARQTRR